MRQDRPIALVLTCEHAENRVPEAYRALFARHGALLESHRGWDPGALGLARVLARGLGAPLLYTDVTRLLVEANRSKGHRELFSRVTRGLGRAERADIVARYYTPHWERVWGLIAARVARGA